MKIVSFVGIKGGIGKTTLALNFAKKLSLSGYNVLLIDLDHQCNLTQSFGLYESENTVLNIFKRSGNVDIHSVGECIDLIAGAMNLDTIESELETKTYKDMLLYMWLQSNYDAIDGDKYDYIVIDCRPDFSIATRNAVSVSHMLVSPIIPSKYSLTARTNLETRLQLYKDENIDYKTGTSNVDAVLYFVGNMVKHNTNTSQDFVKSLQSDERVLGFVPQRELFNKAKLFEDGVYKQLSVYDLVEDERVYRDNKEFISQLDSVYESIVTVLDKLD